ncbi:hydrogenase small subunit [Aneurinibacillus sp. REN35]|uniref:hydrogenase small subunit n=1 Tax=Aneurinibacillus sp. REN35 TaxID=3237286 RepID=UPI0035294081
MNQEYILPPESIQADAVAQRLTQQVRERIREGTLRRKKLVWLELTGCSGNIISLLDGFAPDFEYAITEMVDLVYSNSLMAAEGEEAIKQLMTETEGEFILAVEGAVALKNNGLYNIIGSWQGEPLTALKAAQMLGEKAAHIIVVGACAVDGGPSAAKPNPAQCVGVPDVVQRPMIKLPGCPCHPDWFLGTLAHVVMYGEPPLDAMDRPLMFYGTTIHERCPRLHFFQKGIFAKTLEESTCLFKLGCRGPVTRIDCPTRQWNGHVNWPIGVSTCIGCSQFGFPDQMSPFVSYDITRE